MPRTAIAADDDDPRRALRRVADLRHQAARHEATAVRAARVAGMSWREIAAALGLPAREVRARHAVRTWPRWRAA